MRNSTSEEDYRVYRLTRGEWAIVLSGYFLLICAVGILFYNSVWGILFLVPGFPFLYREFRDNRAMKRKREMQIQFLDGMQITAAALQAGYSIENAFRETRKELQKIYRPDTFIVREFQQMCAQLEVSRTPEEILNSLGTRSGIEEIRSFSEIFETTRKTGGDLMEVVRATTASMRQRQDTMAEIETGLAGKVMEQNIMSAMPIGILGYVRVSSPEFLYPLYHNAAGIGIMTICLAVYLFAFLWGRRIVRIEV